MADILLEVCVDNAEGLQAAIDGGADRIELCSALELGGLTPSYGLMKLASKAPLPVHAMIRPRGGGFVYMDSDEAAMRHDIDMARDLGLAGVVFGALTGGGQLDGELLNRLCQHAQGMDLTLHRAFDFCGPEFDAALETAINLGFHRILTSGGERTALEGLSVLERLFAKAAGRITIMPGSGVNAANIAILKSRLPLCEAHASCSKPVPMAQGPAADLGFEREGKRWTDARLVRALKVALAA
ncbi:MAG: copper homeostasis protein CutC [Rhizobiaceae bacterium]